MMNDKDMIRDADLSEQLVAEVEEARTKKRKLWIESSGTRQRIGKSDASVKAARDCDQLSPAAHTGLVRYEPTELFVTVRSGTPLIELNTLLAERGQMLAFEPPSFGEGTIGGAIACGLSGPRRPFAGAARDHVLGCRFINGRGELLAVGGEVMKNVAGYDVSRLQVGAFGTLGLLLDISLKVLPVAAASATVLRTHASDQEAIEALQPLLRQPLPLAGAVVLDGCSHIRLEGAEAAVAAAIAQLGGESVSDADAFWQSINELQHPFFTTESSSDSASTDFKHLWRLSVPAHAPTIELAGTWLHDWAGALRWYRGAADPEAVFEAARRAGGHATCYSSTLEPEVGFQPLPPAMLALQRRIKDSLDPDGLFNPSRFIV